MAKQVWAFVVGVAVGFVATVILIVSLYPPPFESGVIAAAKNTHVATKVVLPDGTVRWFVTTAHQKESAP